MIDLAKKIDHTNLNATATDSDIEKLCKEALEHGFPAVCVNPTKVALAAKELIDSETKVCTVIGFPLGATTSPTKAFETAIAIRGGATEIDMVINIGAAKAHDWKTVEEDILAVVESAHNNAANSKKEIDESSILVKVIIETCYLTNEEIEKVCLCAKNAGADFIKTSTGFGKEGATVENVRFIKEIVGSSMKIKAAGGIKDKKTAISLLEAGADRLGTSSSIKIIS